MGGRVGGVVGGAMWVMYLCPDRLADFPPPPFSSFYFFNFSFHSGRFPSSGRSEGGRLSRNAAACRVAAQGDCVVLFLIHAAAPGC